MPLKINIKSKVGNLVYSIESIYGFCAVREVFERILKTTKLNIMKRIVLSLITILALTTSSFTQVAINETGADPDPSAILDLQSTTKGFLVPRVSTTERNQIGTTQGGLLVYDTDTESFWYYSNLEASWVEINSGTAVSEIDDLSDAKSDGTSVFLGTGAGSVDDGSNNNSSLGVNSLHYNTSGTHNTSVGSENMYRNTTGSRNTVIGRRGNYYNQEGTNNTIIGYWAGAGSSAHNKSGNVFLGYMAGYYETGDNKLYIQNSSSSTPLIGGDFASGFVDINGDLNLSGLLRIESGSPGAGKVLTSDADGDATWSSPTVYASSINDLSDAGSDAANLFLGDESGINNNGLNFNTGIGIEALKTNSTGISNTATGMGAMQYNTTGYENTSNGHLALQNNTTGNANVAFGKEALLNNTTKSNLTAIGFQSLYYNGTGSTLSTESVENTAVGSKTLYANTLGSQNTAVGTESLKANTTGSGNTSTGAFALDSNTEGDQNTAAGAFSLTNNTTANGNTAFGYKASYSVSDGNYNSSFGLNALYSTTSGTYNSAFSYGSLFLNQTGDENTAFGYKALYSNIIGNENTAIGSRAGYNALGSGNVFIGRYAGYYETGSNKLYIDNSNTSTPLIYGDFDTDEVIVNGSLETTSAISSDVDITAGDDLNAVDDVFVGDDIEVTGDYKYASSRTKILKIPAASFSLYSNQDADRAVYNDYAEWKLDDGNGSGAFDIHAGVTLPEGAVISRFSFYYRTYKDDLYVDLRRKEQFTNFDYQNMSEGSILSDSQYSITRNDDTSINFPIIDNYNYFYYIHVSLNTWDDGGFVKFYGAEIEYTITELK